jgi:leucyl/phenylalanyl-tRNA--protein transferase
MTATGNIPFSFPDPTLAGPDGLLAVGGNLSPETLITAYSTGVFPWYNEDQPILWWSPDPRTVLLPADIHVSRSLGKTLRRGNFRVTCNLAFEEIIRACAGTRNNNPEGDTWITREMRQAYIRLHRLGIAHSVECWDKDRLVGGLYGLSLGRVFFGESMFSLERDASKVALVCLCHHLHDNLFRLIDCQVSSEHILSMGAIKIPRSEFLEFVRTGIREDQPVGMWKASSLPACWQRPVPDE